MMEPTDHDPADDQPCPDCDGSGTITEDRADRRGEHYTAEVPCSTCRASERERFDDEDDDRDDADRWDRDDG